MCIARKPLLLAVLVLATIALAAPVAFAQTEPLTHNQTPQIVAQQEVHGASDVACPAVTPSPPPNPGPTVTAGGCRVHLTSTAMTQEQHLSAGVTVTLSTCAVEFDLRIDSAGEGYASHQEMTGPVGVCKYKPCGQLTPPTSEGRAWSFYLREREPAPLEPMTMLLCTEPIEMGGGPLHCEVTFPLSQPTPHRYRLSSSGAEGHGAPAFPRCEIVLTTFDSEATLQTTGEGQAEQRVEIRHP